MPSGPFKAMPSDYPASFYFLHPGGKSCRVTSYSRFVPVRRCFAHFHPRLVGGDEAPTIANAGSLCVTANARATPLCRGDARSMRGVKRRLVTAGGPRPLRPNPRTAGTCFMYTASASLKEVSGWGSAGSCAPFPDLRKPTARGRTGRTGTARRVLVSAPDPLTARAIRRRGLLGGSPIFQDRASGAHPPPGTCGLKVRGGTTGLKEVAASPGLLPRSEP